MYEFVMKFQSGQAELYHTHVTWKKLKYTSEDEECGRMYVLKVFRRGTFLQVLQKQWPEGMFREHEERVKCTGREESQPLRYTCGIQCGILLLDGRFAFLLVRENKDLWTLINHCMKTRACIDSGPFWREMETKIMCVVAKGMFELYDLNIVYRDLKASNVLCSWYKKKMDKYVHNHIVANVEVASVVVVDSEYSIGVVGAGFFRALGILQALKDKVVHKNPNLFTKEVDVYSYEILTGNLPFEGHCTNDLFLKGDG